MAKDHRIILAPGDNDFYKQLRVAAAHEGCSIPEYVRRATKIVMDANTPKDDRTQAADQGATDAAA